jgi:hypothetical protein
MDRMETGPERVMWELVHQAISHLFLVRTVRCVSVPLIHSYLALTGRHNTSIGLLLAFLIPRVPSFSFNNGQPLQQASGSFGSSIPTEFSRAPANFSFPAYADLELNTQSNFIPLTFNHLRGQVFDLGTGMQVASGDLGHKTVPAKSFPIVQLPLNFTYIASNDSDQTCE